MNGLITILMWGIIAVGVSFLCSVIEAVMLSLSDAQVAAISNKNPKLGYKWELYKEDISKPLFGVLTLNTIASIVGAGGVGAATLEAYGESAVAVSSAILTFFILVVSELIPKTIGERYAKPLAGITAHSVAVINFMTYPIVAPFNFIKSLLPDEDKELLELDDVHGMIELAGDAGVIKIKTEKILNNVLVYSRQTVEDLMTPIEIVETVEYGNKDDYKIPMNYSKCPTVESLVPGETAAYMRCDVGYDVYHTARVPGSTPALDITNHLRTADMVFVTDEGDNTIGILCREDVLDALLAQPTKG